MTPLPVKAVTSVDDERFLSDSTSIFGCFIRVSSRGVVTHIRNDGSRVRQNESSSVCYIKSNRYLKRIGVYECKEHKLKLHTTKS